MSTLTPFHARRATDRLNTFSGSDLKRSVRVCKIELSGSDAEHSSEMAQKG
jgi:hypothetical protein